jgi:mono/diheme cytochrome c family protein
VRDNCVLLFAHGVNINAARRTRMARVHQIRGGDSIMKLTTAVACVAGVFWSVGAAAQDQAQVEHGMMVYAAQKCSVCHSIGGKGMAKGPLDGIGSKLNADAIREWLVNAVEAAKKANATRKPPMKSYSSLPKEDLDGLVAYMLSLKK